LKETHEKAQAENLQEINSLQKSEVEAKRLNEEFKKKVKLISHIVKI